jgi:hypothetical protein
MKNVLSITAADNGFILVEAENNVTSAFSTLDELTVGVTGLLARYLPVPAKEEPAADLDKEAADLGYTDGAPVSAPLPDTSSAEAQTADPAEANTNTAAAETQAAQ